MNLVPITLYDIAYARSGDKGMHSNVGVIAYTKEGYAFLEKSLTEGKIKSYFKNYPLTDVKRYPMPNLLAFNFVLSHILGEGGSRSLRVDAQGKALGQILLEMPLEISIDLLPKCKGARGLE